MRNEAEKMLSWGSLKQLLRYGCVGVAVNSLGYVIYLLVAWLLESPMVTVALLYPVGATVGYFMHARYSFQYTGSHASGLLRYAMAHVAGFVVNLAVLWLGVDLLRLRHEVVQLVAIAIVAVQLFLMLKLCVYTRTDAAE